MRKINYRLASGKVVDLNVDDNFAEGFSVLERQDANSRRKARWRKEKSLEQAVKYKGEFASSVDIEADFLDTEEKDTLIDAISSLSQKQQRLVKLRYYEGKTEVEIAKIFGVSQQAVNQQFITIHKAIKKYFKQF